MESDSTATKIICSNTSTFLLKCDSKYNILLQIEQSYCSTRTTSRKLFLRMGHPQPPLKMSVITGVGDVTRPYKEHF